VNLANYLILNYDPLRRSDSVVLTAIVAASALFAPDLHAHSPPGIAFGVCLRPHAIGSSTAPSRRLAESDL